MIHCPLCLNLNYQFYSKNNNRDFLRCNICDLVFVPNSFYLTKEDEFERYKQHENNALDERYRKYFTNFVDHISPFLEKQNLKGLDYGCGESTLLADILNEQGHRVKSYDPFFHPQHDLLENHYEMVWMSEVWEHLSEPKVYLDWLVNHLDSNGFWILRTALRVEDSEFNNWYYKNDPTHIIFASTETFKWLTKNYPFKIVEVNSPYVLLKKLV